MEQELRMEFETRLNKVCLHIYTKAEYKEDYQLPMIRQNSIFGILHVDGCEVEGTGHYMYDVSGLVSMKTLFENTAIKKEDIQNLVQNLLKSIESLQQYMLNPDCLILQPEYIFRKDGSWYFCYVPVNSGSLSKSFHELSEYFVRTLDYEDTEGIFLAYELHKATLQEHYNLSVIMDAYEEHRERRSKEKEERCGEHEYGNIFSFTEEEEENEEEERYEAQFHGQKKYRVSQKADTIHEESGWRPVWKKAFRRFSGKGWGKWDDLILETDGQDENSTL